MSLFIHYLRGVERACSRWENFSDDSVIRARARMERARSAYYEARMEMQSAMGSGDPDRRQRALGALDEAHGELGLAAVEVRIHEADASAARARAALVRMIIAEAEKAGGQP